MFVFHVLVHVGPVNKLLSASLVAAQIRPLSSVDTLNRRLIRDET